METIRHLVKAYVFMMLHISNLIIKSTLLLCLLSSHYAPTLPLSTLFPYRKHSSLYASPLLSKPILFPLCQHSSLYVNTPPSMPVFIPLCFYSSLYYSPLPHMPTLFPPCLALSLFPPLIAEQEFQSELLNVAIFSNFI